MILRKLTLALSAVALSFSVSAFAQQTAPQPDQQAPTNPAGEVIGKLATMGHMQFGDFPVTQTELDRASEFVQARAAQTGKTITRDQSLVALGYIAGQLGVFMQLQGNGKRPAAAPDDDLARHRRLFLLLRQRLRSHLRQPLRLLLSPLLNRHRKQLRPLLKPTTSFLREQFRLSRSNHS